MLEIFNIVDLHECQLLFKNARMTSVQIFNV